MAYEDYELSLKRGYYRSKVRRDFLKENNITSKGDWFMLGDDKESGPTNNCYSDITRKVKRK